MSSRLIEHLRALYGEAKAIETFARVQRICTEFRDGSGGNSDRPGPHRLTERDSMLITYADQVQEPGVAPLEKFAQFAEEHLQELVSSVHLLPFFPWSSDDGFAVGDYCEVEPSYGTWTDITRLSKSYKLMFDLVLNHMSAESQWFRAFLANDERYREFFLTADEGADISQVIRPRTSPLLTKFHGAAGAKNVWTTFSADQVDLNFRNPEVLLAILKVLLLYVNKGAHYIRLDAIAFLWKEAGTGCLHLPQTHRVVQLMRAVLDEVAPHVLLITETNVPHVDNVSYFGDGTNEAQMVYNFALPPLVLHSFISENALKLTRWAQSLALPSEHVTFFNFLASHDGIGVNPARGILSDGEIAALIGRTVEHGGLVSFKSLPDGSEIPYELNINYLDALSNPMAGEPVELAARKFLTSQAIMLSLQGVPGIYFHSLFGSRGDVEGARTSGSKRRINREKLDYRQIKAELEDLKSLRHAVFSEYSRMLEMRREHPAFAPTSPQRILELDSRLFVVLRHTRDGGERMVCLHNISQEEVRLASLGGEHGELRTLLQKVPALRPYEFVWQRLPG